ncbi:MAG: histidine phosphatase family protein [Chloroflexi bacterium]|nr:histidine phosphatase family protein [Chloroflexota bacterium]
MNLYLVRHGETDWNREGRVQGRADTPLNALGKAQAEALAAYLSRRLGQDLAAVYSSPALRARQTAEAIAAPLGLKLRLEEGLLELAMGEMDGVSLREMRDRFPDFFRLWTTDTASARFPGGETLSELQDRVWTAIQRIAKAHGSAETVVVVSHAFALYAILCKALGLSLNNYGRLHQDPGGVSLLVSRRGRRTDDLEVEWTLTLLNQTSHLDGLAAT